jgi:putative colanic acid biosynthesis acetyltransferase WcaB
VVLQDWAVNRHALKPRLVLASYRAAGAAPEPFRLPVRALHRLLVEWILGVELPWDVEAGPRLVLYHGQGLVVNPRTKLGSDCVLRHGVTIGARRSGEEPPRVGDRVVFGAHAIVIGAVTIGDGAVIGAGAVVTRDVPAGAVMVGNPARELRPADDVQAAL